MKNIVGVIAIVVAAAAAACGGDDGGNNPDDCENVAGTWGFQGTCGADICEITQTGCSTALSCSGGSGSYSGSVDGNHVMYSGQSAGGVDADCDGTISGNTMTGTCALEIGECTFEGIRQ